MKNKRGLNLFLDHGTKAIRRTLLYNDFFIVLQASGMSKVDQTVITVWTLYGIT